MIYPIDLSILSVLIINHGNFAMFQLKGRDLLNRLSTMSFTYDHLISTFGEDSFEGDDVSIEISLKDYGFAWQVLGSKTKFIYGVEWNGAKGEYVQFDYCFLDSDLDVFKEFEWADFEGIYSYTGLTEKQWKDLPMPLQIADLQRFHGRENIFGIASL